MTNPTMVFSWNQISSQRAKEIIGDNLKSNIDDLVFFEMQANGETIPLGPWRFIVIKEITEPVNAFELSAIEYTDELKEHLEFKNICILDHSPHSFVLDKHAWKSTIQLLSDLADQIPVRQAQDIPLFKEVEWDVLQALGFDLEEPDPNTLSHFYHRSYSDKNDQAHEVIHIESNKNQAGYWYLRFLRSNNTDLNAEGYSAFFSSQSRIIIDKLSLEQLAGILQTQIEETT